MESLILPRMLPPPLDLLFTLVKNLDSKDIISILFNLEEYKDTLIRNYLESV